MSETIDCVEIYHIKAGCKYEIKRVLFNFNDSCIKINKFSFMNDKIFPIKLKIMENKPNLISLA